MSGLEARAAARQVAGSADLYLDIVKAGLCRGDDGAFVVFCLERAEPGANLALSSLVLKWLARQPGFSNRTGSDLPATAPLHLVVAQDEAFDRWQEHCGGLVGNPTGAARLREDLFPEAGCWIRRPVGSDRFAASLTPVGDHRSFEGASRDEAAASIAATLRAYQAMRAEVRARQECAA